MDAKSNLCLVDISNPEKVREFTEAFRRVGEEKAAANIFYIVGRAYQNLFEKDRGLEYNYKKAVYYFNKATELNSKDYHSYQAKGLVLMRLGSWHFRLGNIDKVKQFYQEAIENYTKAIELKPDFAHSYNNRGNTRRMMAFRTIRSIEELKEEDEEIQKYLKEAQDDHNKAIELDDTNEDFYINRASNTFHLNYLTLKAGSDNKGIDEINKDIGNDLYRAVFLAREKGEGDKLKKSLEPRYTPLLKYIRSELFAPYLEGDPGNSLGWLIK